MIWHAIFISFFKIKGKTLEVCYCRHYASGKMREILTKRIILKNCRFLFQCFSSFIQLCAPIL